MKILLIGLWVILGFSCAIQNNQVFKKENRADPISEITGVGFLLEEIDQLIQLRKYKKAADIIQRGLRISPDNAVLWQRFALLEIKLGNYTQAEQNALRSIRFSSKNGELIGINNKLIAKARELSE